jgi:hypothetical protein
MRIALAVAASSLVVLAGCGQSEEALRNDLRSQMMSRCTTDMTKQIGQLPGVNLDQFCGCVSDKAFGSRPMDDLKKMRDDKEYARQQGMQAAMQCLQDQMPGVMGG